MMNFNIGIKSDYSLLKSLIKLTDLISFAKNNEIDTLGLLDDNLYSSIEFYRLCTSNNIKPIIGLHLKLNDLDIYLYAKNYEGYQELIKIDLIKKDITLEILNNISSNIIIVLPCESINLKEQIRKEIYFSYKNIDEYNLVRNEKNVYINITLCFSENDIKFLKYLTMIDEGSTISTYTKHHSSDSYFKSTNFSAESFCDLINIVFPEFPVSIPHYDMNIPDSFKYLVALSKKGLEKRISNPDKRYIDRLNYELGVINELKYVDYFLIVYDYVKYAKQNDILVGPGRGSAAGSLVSFCLGITDIDPIKYELLFERFLNKDRVTMPDIDIDFEFSKRNCVIDYVEQRYGYQNSAEIMTYGTLGSKQVIKDVGKCLEIDTLLVDKLSSYFNSSESLAIGMEKDKVIRLVGNNKELKNLFIIASKLERLKKHISTHAAGVVISDTPLINRIPIIKDNSKTMTGITMNYLEDLGLLKMDFLALKDLTIIKNILDLIFEKEGIKLCLRDIPLNDEKTLELFRQGNTMGVFQFESKGMVNFLRKLKPTSFDDLISAVALFRPGPMDNIDSFINRKEGKELITYQVKELEPILSNTYGIIVYQEQILQILNVLADYSYAEADIVRRAMSKKKMDVMEKEQEKFISNVMKKGYSKEVALSVFETIMKFANYGFNKAHSVSYAALGFYMAYLKANYFKYFIVSILNLSLGSEIKIKEYLDEAKINDIKILKPKINYSVERFIIKEDSLLLPLSCIKNVGSMSVSTILNEYTKGSFIDFFDFTRRCYGQNVNRKTIEVLIKADVFSNMGYNHQTLMNNIDSAITYAELIKEVDESLVLTPEMEIFNEYNEIELMQQEIECYGFHITNHPASKYNKSTKIKNLDKFFDKICDFVVIINKVNKIKTKDNQDMAFVVCEDETGSTDAVVFPANFKLIDNIKTNTLAFVRGRVTKRFSKYQITIMNIKEVGDVNNDR